MEAKEAIAEARVEAKAAAQESRELVKEARKEVEEARVVARVADERAAKAEHKLETLRAKMKEGGRCPNHLCLGNSV